MPTLLEHPKAQTLLDQTTVDPDQVRPCARRLTAFVQRYLPCFFRDEQRLHAETILRGKLSGLQRKTTEPIAAQAQQKRRPLQHFVGAGCWQDADVREELRGHVAEELADDHAVLALDPSGFPKKGTESCGVARQWCGRLGKVDNCQVGVFLGYVTPRGQALIDTQLYLPAERAADTEHRDKTYVPEEIVFQEKWRLALELLRRNGPKLLHGWVTGDDEFGRVTEFREQLRLDGEQYVLDVPCNTSVRDLSQRRSSPKGGRARCAPWERVDVWAARQPKRRWRKFTIRGGEEGPLEVEALQQQVQTKDADGRVGPVERLVVIRSRGSQPRTWYTLTNAVKKVRLSAVVQVHNSHHGVEELFATGKGEVGLDEYEVRSWTGWAHHMTLSMLALWFLQLERLRLGKKTPGITVSQVRQIFTELLRGPKPTVADIAAKVSAVLQRTEESRIYHWHERTGQFPPSRERCRPPPGENFQYKVAQ